MNRDDIIRMAREAGFSEWAVQTPQDLERFAALVISAERDACIALCEEHWRNNGNAMECADAIRARGEK